MGMGSLNKAWKQTIGDQTNTTTLDSRVLVDCNEEKQNVLHLIIAQRKKDCLNRLVSWL